jgi:electron transport complex protein RnfA
LRKFIPSLYSALGIYLPLITTNCAVLSAALLNIQNGYNFIESVCFGFAAAIGFTLAIVVFAGVRMRVATANPPRAFSGFPLTLIAAGLLAMAFSGFSSLSF